MSNKVNILSEFGNTLKKHMPHLSHDSLPEYPLLTAQDLGCPCRSIKQDQMS